MKTFRVMFVVAMMSLAAPALADLTAPPPPNFGDCTAEKQKKAPTDECQECNNLYQDGCEKQLKDKGLVRACQIKPENSSEWREVWCKAPAKAPEPAKDTARAVTETTKEGGCAVDPAAGGSWLLIAAFAAFIRRKRAS